MGVRHERYALTFNVDFCIRVIIILIITDVGEAGTRCRTILQIVRGTKDYNEFGGESGNIVGIKDRR